MFLCHAMLCHVMLPCHRPSRTLLEAHTYTAQGDGARTGLQGSRTCLIAVLATTQSRASGSP